MASRSTRTSTLVATLFTFWPPGPDARTARTCNARSGTRTTLLTTIARLMPRLYLRDVLRLALVIGSPRTAGPQPRDVLRLGLAIGSPRTAGAPPRDVLRLALHRYNRSVTIVERRRLTDVARGAAPADLYVRGGTLLNVYTGEIYPANVADPR